MPSGQRYRAIVVINGIGYFLWPMPFIIVKMGFKLRTNYENLLESHMTTEMLPQADVSKRIFEDLIFKKVLSIDGYSNPMQSLLSVSLCEYRNLS